MPYSPFHQPTHSTCLCCIICLCLDLMIKYIHYTASSYSTKCMFTTGKHKILGKTSLVLFKIDSVLWTCPSFSQSLISHTQVNGVTILWLKLKEKPFIEKENHTGGKSLRIIPGGGGDNLTFFGVFIHKIKRKLILCLSCDLWNVWMNTFNFIGTS